MKIKLNDTIKGIDGKALVDDQGVAITLENGAKGFLKYGTKVITNSGETVELKDESKEKTLADIFMTVCTVSFDEEQKNPDGKKILELRKIAELCFKNQKGNAELSREEVEMLRERVLKVYPDPIVYGGVCDILSQYDKD